MISLNKLSFTIYFLQIHDSFQTKYYCIIVLLYFLKKEKMVQTKSSISRFFIAAILSLIILTHIVNYYKSSRKIQQCSNQVAEYLIF